MQHLIKIIFTVFVLTGVLLGGQAVTTGDLIIALDGSDDWPPVVLDRPELPLAFDTEHFKIHYTVEGEYAVYHPDEDVNPFDGVPDYVNRMAEFLELTRYTYITVLGYDYPPPDGGMGGDDRYDIYVTNITGSTEPEYPSDYYPDRLAYTSFIFIGNDLRNQNHPDDPIPFLKATCAHEYFHAVQMAYRAYTNDETDWWYELTANWAEEQVFDDLNEIYYYLEDYYMKIEHSIHLTDGNYMHGAWIFAEYLSSAYGTDIIRQIFNTLIYFDNSIIAIKTALSVHEINFDEAFSIFAGWNYFTGMNSKPGFYEEGEFFPVTVPLAAEHSSYPTDWIDTPTAIENLGIAYIWFNGIVSDKARLVIDFVADDNYPTGITVGAVYYDQPVSLTYHKLEAGQDTIIQVLDFNDCEGVVMAINWPYQIFHTPDTACYQYYAYIDTTTTEITSNNPIQPGTFELIGNYPNPFNLSCNIIFNWNSNQIDYKIIVYDIAGRKIEQIDGFASTGLNSAVWTPKSTLASGVYFYRLEIGDYEKSARVLLLK